MVIHSLCLQKVKPTVYAKPQIFSLSLRGEEKFLTYCLLKLKIFKRLKGIKMKSKKENRSRPIQKNVRFSEAELNYLNKKIERSPFNNFQNYARILLLTGEVKMVDYSELQRLNEEEIRTFMPRHYRQAMQTQLIQNEKVELLQASSLHLS